LKTWIRLKKQQNILSEISTVGKKFSKLSRILLSVSKATHGEAEPEMIKSSRIKEQDVDISSQSTAPRPP
jgi:hypothetical protein